MDGWDGVVASQNNLYEFTKYNTIARYRARIQNTYGLFLASEPIRQRRRSLSQEEREVARASPDRFAKLEVFADETGKTGRFLIAGGIWFAHPRDVVSVQRELFAWRNRENYKSELHFQKFSSNLLDLYCTAIEVAYEAAPTASYMALKMPRVGITNMVKTLDSLSYHFLVLGAEHEHLTGRSKLPRTIDFAKDKETPGEDRLRLADLRDRVNNYGGIHWDHQLRVGDSKCLPSNDFDIIQIADLFIGCIGRKLSSSTTDHPKDQLAQYLLSKVGMPNGPNEFVEGRDATHLFSL